MKKLLSLACCSIFLLTACGQTSYYQSNEQVEEDSSEIPDEAEDVQTELIYVQVSGAVVEPGVYELPSGSRVYEAIDAAGGLLENADDSDLNQAALLDDGQKLQIYTEDERQLMEEQSLMAVSVDDGLININTASVSELTSLPGIGEAKANQIISYRDSNGGFSSIEDIKNVSGIGDGIFNQINSLIKI